MTATQPKSAIIIISDFPQPGTLGMLVVAGRAGRYPLYIGLSLSLGVVSKNQHIIDTISHL